jgi:hypothetical protein
MAKKSFVLLLCLLFASSVFAFDFTEALVDAVKKEAVREVKKSVSSSEESDGSGSDSSSRQSKSYEKFSRSAETKKSAEKPAAKSKSSSSAPAFKSSERKKTDYYAQFTYEQDILNFTKDDNIVATWIFNNDGTVTKKGYEINGLVKSFYTSSYGTDLAYSYIRYADNKPSDGLVKYFYVEPYVDGGVPYCEFTYKEGKLSGDFRSYFKSGRIKEEYFINGEGKIDGIKKEYHPDVFDTVKTEYVYQAGTPQTYKEYNVKGALIEEGRLNSAGKKHGLSQCFDAEIPYHKAYSNGKFSGLDTNKTPVNVKLYEQVDKHIASLRAAGYNCSEEPVILYVNGTINASLKSPKCIMNITASDDKKSLKQVSKSVGLLSFFGRFFTKEKYYTANYMKDNTLFMFIAEDKTEFKSAKKLLKKTIKGIKKV